MKKPKRIGIYEHFSMVIIAQGNWKDDDLQEIRNIILDERKRYSGNEYPFAMKFVYRTEKPEYSDCQLCKPLYDLLLTKKGNYQGIIYQGHHYLDLEDDSDDMGEIITRIIDNEKVKKIFILYLDSLEELKRDYINSMTFEDLTNIVTASKKSKSEFLNILSEGQFQNRALYEILKDTY